MKWLTKFLNRSMLFERGDLAIRLTPDIEHAGTMDTLFREHVSQMAKYFTLELGVQVFITDEHRIVLVTHQGPMYATRPAVQRLQSMYAHDLQVLAKLAGAVFGQEAIECMRQMQH